MTTERNTAIIVFDAENQIKHERVDDFGKSVFRDNYIGACKEVRKIISATKNYHLHKLNTTSYVKNSIIYNNIIAFTGNRGVGKTSAMLSFADFLCEYNSTSENKNKLFSLSDNDEQLFFTGLDCIDASLLEMNEDIFEVVLASMYQKFVDFKQQKSFSTSHEDYEYKKRELVKDFDRINNDLRNLNKKDSFEEETSYETLMQLSRSRNLRKSFRSLTKRYMEVLQNNVDYKNCYIVIPVDDLDMNIKCGFRMLEKIHKLLMIPNVIVLMTINMDQLVKISCRNFIEQYQPMLISDATALNNMVEDYLESVIPAERRISIIPGSRYGEYNNKKITFSFADTMTKQQDVWGFISNKISQGLDIQLYNDITNRSYYEGHTLRQLSYLCYSLDEEVHSSLNNGEIEWDEYYKNYEWMKSDIANRLTNNVSTYQRDLILQLLRTRYSERNEFLIQGLCKEIKNSDYVSEEYRSRIKEMVNKGDYSLMTVVTALYASRIFSDTNYLFANIIILAYSLFLSRSLSEIEKNNADSQPEVVKSAQNRLSNIIRIRYIFGENDVDWFYNNSQLDSISKLTATSVSIIQVKETVKNSPKEIFKKYKKAIHIGEVFIMFLNRDKKDRIKFTVREREQELIVENCYFRISDFILNIFDYKIILNDYYNNLACLFAKSYKVNQSNMLEAIIGGSMLGRYDNWHVETGTRRVIPFQNVQLLLLINNEIYCQKPKDFSCGCTTKTNSSPVVIIREVIEYYFQQLENVLGVAEETFKKNIGDENSSHIVWKEIYENCPFIQELKDQDILKCVCEKILSAGNLMSEEREKIDLLTGNGIE